MRVMCLRYVCVCVNSIYESQWISPRENILTSQCVSVREALPFFSRFSLNCVCACVRVCVYY